jgi:hypothetical protein
MVVENGEALVEIQPRGKDNEVQSVTYFWSDKTGKVTVPMEEMDLMGESIPIEDEVLTIRVIDARGVVTTRKAWVPDWLLEQ